MPKATLSSLPMDLLGPDLLAHVCSTNSVLYTFYNRFKHSNPLQRVTLPFLMQEYIKNIQIDQSLPIQRVVYEQQIYPNSRHRLPTESKKNQLIPSRTHRESFERPSRYRDKILNIETATQTEVSMTSLQFE
jgi:hypothetical protein